MVDWPRLGKVYQGVNVSDRDDDWTKNFRCPDVAVYLTGNPAVAKGAYWHGGPDFAVEILSPDDRSREKLDFYARVGVRELLLIDRDPWALELYRRNGAEWALAGRSTLEPVRFASSSPARNTKPAGCAKSPRSTSKARRSHRYFPIKTSVDLMIATTSSPGFNSMRSAEPRVMAETNSSSPTATTTSAITSPR